METGLVKAGGLPIPREAPEYIPALRSAIDAAVERVEECVGLASETLDEMGRARRRAEVEGLDAAVVELSIGQCLVNWQIAERYPARASGRPKDQEKFDGKKSVPRWHGLISTDRVKKARRLKRAMQNDKEQLLARCQRAREALEPLTLSNLIDMRPARAKGTGAESWYTPREIIEAARSVMGGIDLDPASSDEANAVVRAEKFYTAEDDGLSREWHGRVWMNPPYTRGLVGRFTDRLIEERIAGRVEQGVVLVNAQTDAAWWQRLARAAEVVCVTEGRVRFWRSVGSASEGVMGQAIFGVGVDVEPFRKAIGGWGVCLSSRS